MKAILVLGPGCVKCRKLKENVDETLRRTGIPASVEHVTAMSEILAYDVLATPALVIDGEVISVGRLLSVDEIQTLLENS